ncbi:sialidase-3-like, partial [Saccoglossus kowalevskii]|uniref:Sialidase-4-like n=1 Tax=Saccoglossus kowalevskii TaxID=10224 RepID=A0ABM0M0C4_SACKO
IPALIFHQGVFIAFCEARKDSAADDGNMDILMRRGRRSSMNNVTWDEPRTLVSIARKRVMNPTPIVDRKRGALVLVFISLDPWKTEGFLKRQHRYDEAVYIIKSMDNGLTWSEPVDITSSTLGAMTPIPSMFASGPGHGIQLESGRLIVPGNVYIKHKDAPKNSQSCFDYSMVLYSDDGGDTWTPGGKVPIKTDTQGIMIQTNEAQAVELGSNHVCLNCRTLSELQSRAISCSWDGGITFGLPKLNAKLVEPGFWMRKGSITISGAPGCQGSTIEFPAPPGTKITHLVRKTWALFSNPASMGLRQGESIRISKDGMNSWSEPWTVHRGNSGYSDLTYFETLDNSNIVQNFAVLYEKGADTDSAYHDAIVFKTFTLDDVLENTQL